MNPIAYLLAWLDSQGREAKQVLVVLSWIVTFLFASSTFELLALVFPATDVGRAVRTLVEFTIFVLLVRLSFWLMDRWWKSDGAGGRLPAWLGGAVRWQPHRKCIRVTVLSVLALTLMRVGCSLE